MLLIVFITIIGTMSLYIFTKSIKCNFHPTTCKSISSDALYVILHNKFVEEKSKDANMTKENHFGQTSNT